MEKELGKRKEKRPAGKGQEARVGYEQNQLAAIRRAVSRRGEKAAMGEFGRRRKRMCGERKIVMKRRGKSRRRFGREGAQRRQARRVGKHTGGGGRQERGTWKLMWTACVACVGVRACGSGRGTDVVVVGCGRRCGRWIIKNGRSGLRRRGKERPGSTGVEEGAVGKNDRQGTTGHDRGQEPDVAWAHSLRNWPFRGQRHSLFTGEISKVNRD